MLTMTREQLEQELETFETRKQQFINDANACNGVLQYLRLKLAELNEQDKGPKLVLPSGSDITAVQKTKE